MARKVGNTKRIGYAVSKRNQNRVIPFLGGGAMFALGMFAGKLEVMAFPGKLGFLSFLPQSFGKAFYFIATLWLALPGYFGYEIMPYFEWNRLVLIIASSIAWGAVFWLVATLKRR